MSLTTVTHTLVLPDSVTPRVNSLCAVKLVGVGFIDEDESEIVKTSWVGTNDVGLLTMLLTPNTEIEPANSYYSLTASGQTWAFAVPVSDDPVWLGDILLVDPQPGPAIITAEINVPKATGVTATDWANINSAVNRATRIAAAGGRPTIVFQSCAYESGTLTPYSLGPNTIPIVQGVAYVGAIPGLSAINQGAGYLPDGEWDYVGGTVLLGDGTAPAFAVNNVPVASIVNPTWGESQVSGVRIFGFGLDTFSGGGIAAGAQNVMGLVWSEIDEIYAKNCDWGVRFINYQHVQFGKISTCLMSAGQQYYAAQVAATTLAPGNSQMRDLFAVSHSGTGLTRGIVFEANSSDGAAASLTIGTVTSVQHNAFSRTLTSQTATFSGSGNPNITVTDGTKFLPGLPVIFTTSGLNFTAGIVYYVLTVSGNTITVGNSKFDTGPVNASGSGTLTITHHGFDNIEVAANHGGVINGVFSKLDCEGSATVGLYQENTLAATFSSCGPGTLSVGRNAASTITDNGGGHTYDLDSISFRTIVHGNACKFLQYVPSGVRQGGVANDSALALGQYNVSATEVWGANFWKGGPANSFTTFAMVSGVARATMIDVPDRLLEAIGINITSAGDSTSVIRLGIYYNQNGKPLQLLVDAGTVPGNVLGFASIALSNKVSAGQYWVVAVAQLATATSPTVSAMVCPPRVGNPVGQTECLGTAGGGFTMSGVSGALPSTWTTSGEAATQPRVVLQAL